jgi:hypothetical protein
MREPIRVIEPQAVKESLRVSKTAKPIWIAVVATLLWGINGLKVQSVVHELIVTIAISQHRIDSLLALEGKCIPNTKTLLVRCSTSSQSVLDSELRTVQVRLRSTSRRELNRIEQALEIATQPTFLSQEYENIAKELRLANWMHESWAHTVKVLRADHDRELARQDVSTDKPVYRLVGFKNPQPEGPPELEKEMATYSTRIRELEQSLEKAKSKSKGFLSFTGSKRQYPVVSALGWWRLSVLSLMAFACWFSASILLKRESTFSISPNSWSAVLKRIWSNNKRNEPLTGQSIGGVPCLGNFVVLTDSLLSFSPRRESENESLVRKPRPVYVVRVQASAIVFARVLLILWFAVFAMRFLIDASWRELFFASPLAGLSRIAGGVF